MSSDKTYYDLKFKYLCRLQIPIEYDQYLLRDKSKPAPIPIPLPNKLNQQRESDFYLDYVEDLKEYKKNVRLRRKESMI